MARAFNQKLKILYLMQMLLEQTDAEHVLDMQQILSILEEKGVTAERKSIYDDIGTLRQFGLNVLFRKGQPTGYYLGSREFELTELKILADAIQSSGFITEKKALELIEKLKNQVSRFEAWQLPRQIYVKDRIKTMNESIYYKVDKIQGAISADHPISFQYWEWNVKKEMELRKSGQRYVISPWFFNWDHENYYLVAYDHSSEKMKSYRVDKMVGIQSGQGPRMGVEKAAEVDMEKYAGKRFGMSGGKEETLEVLFKDKLAGAVIDHFGKNITIKPQKDGTFKARLTVVAGEPFYGWLSSLGTGTRIVKPKSAAEEYRMFLKKLLKQYK